jgi:hypothetical protein
MVANWRVKITTSRMLTPEPKESENSFGFVRTDTGTILCLRRYPTTSSLDGRSISPVFKSPEMARAEYWKVGMDTDGG